VSPGGITEQEKKVLRAAAKAQVQTGVPLTVHLWGDPPGKWPGFEALEILQATGADAKKLYFSHMDWTFRQTNDWSLALKMASKGAYVAFDNFGNEWPASTQYRTSDSLDSLLGAATDLERLQGVKEIIAAGLQDQLLLSHDICQKIHLKKFGGHGLDHIQTNIANLFEKVGIDRKMFSKFTRENPARLFS
jgi:phosphotriesterase-related protein